MVPARTRDRYRQADGASPFVELEVAGHTVKVTNPDKVFFPARGETKLDLAQYYVAVGEGALRGVPGAADRPQALPQRRHRRAVLPEAGARRSGPSGSRPSGSRFPSGRHADELCPVDVAHVVWAANLGCLDLNPWAVRRADVDHPDELRVDLDPQPGVAYAEVQAVAATIHDVLDEHELVGYPKTSGSRGIHVNVRIEPRWDFLEMRRAALALAREVERRMPDARDLEVVEGGAGRPRLHRLQPERPRPHRRVGVLGARRTPRAACPARSRGPRSWTRIPATSRSRPCRRGTRRSATRRRRSTTCAFSLQPLLDLAARDEREGLGDEAWPPNFPKAAGEPKRVAPSRAKKEPARKPAKRSTKR